MMNPLRQSFGWMDALTRALVSSVATFSGTLLAYGPAPLDSGQKRLLKNFPQRPYWSLPS